MSHNVFQFGDTFWLQLTDTAMGTPPVSAYVTIYFVIHKICRILDTYGKCLLFYKRYLDDVFGIWFCSDPTKDAWAWKSFQADMNAFGKLQWEFSNCGISATFLNLMIELKNDEVMTTLFEKNSICTYTYLCSHVMPWCSPKSDL